MLRGNSTGGSRRGPHEVRRPTQTAFADLNRRHHHLLGAFDGLQRQVLEHDLPRRVQAAEEQVRTLKGEYQATRGEVNTLERRVKGIGKQVKTLRTDTDGLLRRERAVVQAVADNAATQTEIDESQNEAIADLREILERIQQRLP